MAKGVAVTNVRNKYACIIQYRVPKRKKPSRAAALPFYFIRTSRTQINSSLRLLKKDIYLGKNVNWKEMHRVYRQLKFNERSLPYSINFLIDICKCLEKYNCKEECVIHEVLQILFYATHCTSDLKIVNKFIRTLKITAKCDEVIRKCKQKQFFEYNFGLHLYVCEDIVWYTARSANLGLLKLMLKFGLKVLGLGQYDFNTISSECFIVQKRLRYLQPAWESHSLKKNIKMFLLRLPIPMKRLLLIIRTLDMITRMDGRQDYLANLGKCYRLLFDTIPEPFISSTEVETFLKEILPDATDDSIFQVVEKLKILSPEVHERPQPRSLQHLCRVQIRESLCKSACLSYGASSLWLPKTLKGYLLLDDDGDYSIISRHDGALCQVLQTSDSVSLVNIPNSEDFILKYVREL